jgi:serine protease Do
MIGTRRACRVIIVAIALGSLAIGIADVRGQAPDRAASLSTSFRRAATRARGSLVSVRVADGMPGPMSNGILRPGRFGPVALPPQMFDRELGGDVPRGFTGVVIDADKGYILTADPVIQGTSQQRVVVFPDGQERPANQIRHDPRTGLALLQIDTQGLHLGQVHWGDPAKLQAGDWLIALGQPGVGDPTMSVGIFSTRRRGGGEELLETDAAIPRVGVGGVLINLDGDVVGIARLNARRRDLFDGMSHAIPADRAQRVASDLARFGQVRRAFLGITVEPVEGLPVERRAGPAGVRVSTVGADTPAAEAGIRTGDLIFAVDQRPIDSVADLQEAVESVAIGQVVALSLERQGKRMEIKVKPRAIPTPIGPARTPRIAPGAVPGALNPAYPPVLVPPGSVPDLPED